MSAQDNLSPHQFRTMSVRAVGKLNSIDYHDMTMGEIVRDPDTVDDLWRGNKKYQEEDERTGFKNDVAEHGIRKPIKVYAGRFAPDGPQVEDGHHRYAAAYEAGNPRVPVTGSVKAAKAFTTYNPPKRY